MVLSVFSDLKEFFSLQENRPMGDASAILESAKNPGQMVGTGHDPHGIGLLQKKVSKAQASSILLG